MKRPPWIRRALAGTVTCALVGGLAVSLPAVAAAAPGSTVLFDQSFMNNAADGTGSVVKPATASGADNVACLTAAGGSTGALQSCPDATDANGSGALSLTKSDYYQVGGVFAATSVPTAGGLDVQFTMHQYSDTEEPADGIAFALSAVDPSEPTSPPNIGPEGGALGYAGYSDRNGLANGYLGIGFDAYGNYSNDYYQGYGCDTSPFARPGLTKNQVVVRGPGNETAGYCAINSTGTENSSPAVPMHGTTREDSAVPVQVVINSGDAVATTRNGLTVEPNHYLVSFTPIGAQEPQQLTGELPVMNGAYVGSQTWLDDRGLPKQLAFGWVGSTGGAIDNHDITNLRVSSLVAEVPVMTVDQTSYTRSPDLTTGDPVSYIVTPGVAPGADDPGPVTVGLTTPDGVVPLGGTGDGWTCTPPGGRTIGCTNSNGPFAEGQTLPPITITAVAGTNVSAESIQTATVTTASSDGAQPGYSDAAPAGTNPAQPTITLGSDAGLNTGGNQVVINGTNLGGATAIFLGTPDELTSSLGILLQPCTSTPSPCFTINSDNQIVVNQWPPHATGDVPVTVVSLGLPSNSVTYTYASFNLDSLLITEMRLSGPAGDGDQYVELTNITPGRLPLAGIAIQTASGGNVVLPDDAGSLPAGGTYLVTGPSYSLSAVAPSDFTSPSPLGSGGVRVLSPGENPLVVDAVGSADTTPGFFEGLGLPVFDSMPQAEYGWVRTQQTGLFRNTQVNASDFALVSTDGGIVGGVQSMLGSPSPTSRTTPWDHSSTITSTLLDPSKSPNVAPNRVITKTPGTPGGRVESRRVVTNTTDRAVSSLQLRLIDITELDGLPPVTITPGSPIAALKAVRPSSPTVTINGEVVNNVSPASPSVAGVGGGLNSTFVVPLSAELAPGQSIDVGLTFDASTNGKFSFRYSTEALFS